MADYGTDFPSSRKVHVAGRHGVQVPMREIMLSGGEPPLRVYDPSGPQGIEVRTGLPALRLPWILERNVERVAGRPQADAHLIPEGLRRPVYRGRGPVTQLH